MGALELMLVVATMALTAALGLVAMWVGRRRDEAWRAEWATFERETGVTMQGTFPGFRGPCDGMEARLDDRTYVHKGSRIRQYELAVGLPHETRGMVATRAPWLRSAGPFYDGALVVTGDAEFDRAVQVVARDVELARRTLTPATRAALRRLIEHHPEAEIRSGALGLRRHGIARARQVRADLRALVACAKVFALAPPPSG